MLAAVLMLALAACGDSGGTPADPAADVAAPLMLVATTSILGDVAANIVGDDGTVTVLVPVGADPHDYQASSRQVAAIQGADLVVANGLLLEEGLTDVLERAAADGANVLELGDRLDPLPFESEAGGDADPHIWLDPARMADGARLIGAALAAIDPAIDWSGRAEAYAAELMAADEQIRATLAVIPAGDRKLVTNHDSFGYFADRYDFTVVGVVVPGGSTLAQPSSAELSALVAKLVETGVPAIFAETTESTALADAMAAETDTDVQVVELFTGSLGEPGGGADSLIGMLLTNAERITAALS